MSSGGNVPNGEGVGAWCELGDELPTSITAFDGVDERADLCCLGLTGVTVMGEKGDDVPRAFCGSGENGVGDLVGDGDGAYLDA